jgi:O-antigen/teichoic acid export membrane protein
MNADRATLRWNGIELRRSLGFSGKVSALVALGVLISQTDKFYLSMKVSVEDLGIYGIAYSLSMGILQLGYPLFSAMLPKLVEVRHDMASRASINARMLILILVANITMLAAYFIVGRQILEIWFGNRDTAGQVGAALTPLLISCALNSIYNLGYTNWISLGNSRWILGINLFGFAVALSVTPLAIDRFGYPGASAALLGLNSAGALCALTWLFLSRQRAARN